MNFSNQKVLITGASSGIGEALAQAFNAQDAQVILVARNEKELIRVQSSFKKKIRSWIFVFDVTQTHDVSAFAKKVVDIVGPIDILINNAGLSQRSFASETSFEDEFKLISVNLLGLMALTKAFLPAIIQQKGQIVAISSVMGKINTKYRSAYAAAKHGVVGYYDCLRLELHGKDVNVCNIMPGFVTTNIAKNAIGSTKTIINQSENASGMQAEAFAAQAIKVIFLRKKNVIIGGQKEKFAVLLKRLFPTIFDWFIKNKKVI
jgi:short-subunit dehydrogenase